MHRFVFVRGKPRTLYSEVLFVGQKFRRRRSDRNVFRHIDYFDETKDGYNWILKIAQNVAYNTNIKKEAIIRAEKRFAQSINPKIEEFYDGDDFFTALEGLSDADRAIAVARFYFDETEQTIANRLGVSRAAICKRLKKIYTIIIDNYPQR